MNLAIDTSQSGLAWFATLTIAPDLSIMQTALLLIAIAAGKLILTGE